MERDNPPPIGPVYSIGHSNQPLDALLGLLRRHGIQVLADVRSHPYASYTPYFSREPLEAAVTRAGMRYLFLGQELGGRPEGEEFYDAEGCVLYGKMARSPRFLAGIARLEQEAREATVAVLCSEENPAQCHRHLLIGRVLAERGVAMQHLRADGTVESYHDVVRKSESDRAGDRQLVLFDKRDEAQQWKSTQSVSPRRPRPSSSDD